MILSRFDHLIKKAKHEIDCVYKAMNRNRIERAGLDFEYERFRDDISRLETAVSELETKRDNEVK